MKMTKLAILILLISQLFFSCNYIKRFKKKVIIENELKKIYNTEIALPDSIYIFDNGITSRVKLSKKFSKDFKIITFIDNDCPKCIFSQLLFWNTFLKNNKSNINFNILCFYNGHYDYLCNVMLQEIDFKIPVILDKDSVFYKEHTFFNNPRYQTMLINENNKPIVIGNMIENYKMESLYLSNLKSKKN